MNPLQAGIAIKVARNADQNVIHRRAQLLSVSNSMGPCMPLLSGGHINMISSRKENSALMNR